MTYTVEVTIAPTGAEAVRYASATIVVDKLFDDQEMDTAGRAAVHTALHNLRWDLIETYDRLGGEPGKEAWIAGQLATFGDATTSETRAALTAAATAVLAEYRPVGGPA